MAYEVKINKRFTTKLLNVLGYLEKEWGSNVAKEFLKKVRTRIYTLQSNPYIGSPTSINKVRSTLVTRHNRLYYRIDGNTIVVLNMYDTRSKKRGRFGS
ncbi:MAG: type II toxin-antitoxin system RelE/ParE family toxin [Taibaiella sp.]|nr:type II toxin-antitoxin system RelE/ParE family toxin [Taibaiella sp.]